MENKERKNQLRTTKCLTLFTNRNLLAKSEIHNLQVTVLVNHQILGFQVTIHVSTIMNMSESRNDLSSVYTSCNLLETSQTYSRELLIDKQRPELTTLYYFEEKEKLVLGLKVPRSSNTNGCSYPSSHPLHTVRHLLLLPNLLFLQTLHRNRSS